MSELPMGWEISSLAQVVSKLVDGSHSPPSKQADGLPMLSARNISDGRIIFDDYRLIKQADFEIEDRRTNIRPGDVLLTIVGAIGRTAIVPNLFQKFTLQRSVAVIRLHDGIDSEYLKYVFDAPEFQEWMLENAKGTAQKGIYLKKLGSAHIPVAPLNEQRRIVAKLDRLFARSRCAREELGRVSGLVQRYKQAVLAAATSGEFAEDGQTVDIQSVAKVGTGSTPLKSNSSYYADDGIPWITSAATGQPFVTSASEFVTEVAISDHRLKKYPVGTLLVAMYGEGKTRGQVTELGIEATINQACAAIVVDETLALKEYLKLSLQANYLEMRELAEGGNQPNLNLSKIKNFPLFLPPLQQQKQIVQRVEKLFKTIDLIEQEHQKASKLLDRLEQATLSKAFRGELVPQDPNDEPAAVLLERIQSDRQAQPKGKAIKSKQSHR